MSRRVSGDKAERRGGRRAGAGRKLGTVSEAQKVARARAALMGKLPHELMLEWARTGRMYYPSRTGYVELDAADRISCAKGCAAYYKSTFQPRPAPGEQPPVVRLELDEKMISALAAKAPDKLEVLRDVLRALQAGGADLAATASGGGGGADPSRYGRMLSESSRTAGNA